MNILFITKDSNYFNKESNFNFRNKYYLDILNNHNISTIFHKNNTPYFYFKNNYKFNFFILLNFIKKNKINVIVTQEPDIINLFLGLIKNFLKIKLITQIHGDFFSFKWIISSPFNFIKFSIYIISLLTNDRVRVVNKKTYKIIRKYFKKDCECIPIPIFKKAEIKNDNIINLKEKKIVITFITEFIKIKNPFLINKIIDLFSNKYSGQIQFNVVGDGPLINKFKKKINIKNKAITIQILGILKQDSVYKAIKNSNFVIITSKFESYSRVLIESYLMSTPVFSTNITGPKELIIDNFFLYEENKLYLLYEKIEYLLNNISVYKSYIEIIYKNYLKYDYNDIAKKWCNFIIFKK